MNQTKETLEGLEDNLIRIVSEMLGIEQKHIHKGALLKSQLNIDRVKMAEIIKKEYDVDMSPILFEGSIVGVTNYIKLVFRNRFLEKILQAHEQAEGELGERMSGKDLANGVNDGEIFGFNAMHDIARPILAKALLRIEELEEVIKTGKCKHITEDVLSAECSLCHLAWCELRIKVLEKQIKTMHDNGLGESWVEQSKYQSLKEKLTVPNMIVTLSKIVPHFKCFSGTEQQCEAQALIKDLTGGKV